MLLPNSYEDSFLVSGIMCFDGCGQTIENSIRNYLKKLFPNATIYISSDPMPYGMHKYTVAIHSSEPIDTPDLTTNIKTAVYDSGFEIFDNTYTYDKSPRNWLNILINIIAVATILALSLIFPPSLFLSIGLGFIGFGVTLFTAREYILNFFKSLRAQNFLSMPVTVTLGWLFALGHAIYHMSFMPVTSSFAMIFMSFIMPIILVGIVNIMDEIKLQIKKKSRKVFLNGISSLFPEMQDEYLGVQLSEDFATNLSKDPNYINTFAGEYVNYKRYAICKDMLLKVKAGECFPVDGKIVSGNTYVDKSIINGEPATEAGIGTYVQSGCLNLLEEVVILTSASEYNSTANKLLLQANTDEKIDKKSEVRVENKYYYFYFGLFAAGIISSLVLSSILGTLSIGTMLQTMVGILFAICPCTIGIAHFLPGLLKSYQLHKEDIIVHEQAENLDIVDFDVFIFDKTGTLTSESRVASSEGITDGLWKKIYSIEKLLGRKHPIALALQKHVETKNFSVFNEKISEIIEVSASGIIAKFDNDTVVIGNATFLESHGIQVSPTNIGDGTFVYVATNGQCVGNITVKHELRPGMLESLQKVKKYKKKSNSNQSVRSDNILIMLTGDKQTAADYLNQQTGFLFDNVYAEKTPEKKSEMIAEIVENHPDLRVCFIGDGLNDAMCSKKLQKMGGVSISISSNDKAAFFTNMSLNGCLDYLFVKPEIEKQEKRIVNQNKWIMAYGAIIFLIFLISFQSMGIGISPLIPVVVMFATTLFALFNSYRMQVVTNNLLSKSKLSIANKAMQSNLVTGLLIGASLAIVIAVLIASFASLHLSLPFFVFRGGLINIVSSSFLVAATVMLAGFVGFACAYMLQNQSLVSGSKKANPIKEKIVEPSQNLGFTA